MEKEFVPYEQAFDLEILGFDEPCISRYCVFTEFESPTGKLVLQKTDCSVHESLWLTKAPLYQQVFKWFREKCSIFSSIDVNYCYKIYVNDEFFEESINYNSHEEAELECIKKSIEIVKDGR